MDEVVLFATFEPRTEKAESLRAILETMTEHTRREPGCAVYDLYESNEADSGLTYHLFERYIDEQALKFHRSTSYYRSYREGLPELLQRPVEVTMLRSLNTTSS